MPGSPKPSQLREKSPGVESDATTEEAQRQEAPVARRRKPSRQMQKRSGGGPLGGAGLDNLAGIDSVGQTAQGLTNGVTNTLGNVAGGALDKQGEGGGKSDTLKLRLDLNLDIEITLKARIHGDLELALL